MPKKYDFSGWATRNDIKCADGRTIRQNAFKDDDGQIVPLVWNHRHDDPDNILGYALLENRPNGVYVYGTFNDTERGQNAKALVKHGDITSLSIFANRLKQVGGDVTHGVIREVSLVLAGANPGAFIDSVLAHGYDSDDNEGIIYSGENISLAHSDDAYGKEEETMPKSYEEIINDMSDEQRNTLYDLVAHAYEEGSSFRDDEEDDDDDELDELEDMLDDIEDALDDIELDEDDEDEDGDEDDEDDEEYDDEEESEDEGDVMKHNLFDAEEYSRDDVLSHSEIAEIMGDAKRYGSLKESFLQHGIDNIEYLFPDAKNVSGTPGFINTNPDGWVSIVMNGVHHTPFSRIKMTFADITVDEARAKGYIKGNFKVEEQFGLLRRSVSPTTVYKKQKIDRDDVIDITDFDVVAWLKREMRIKLDEEIARAILFSDGRSTISEDKINEECIIPIAKDTTNNLYAMESTVTLEQSESVGHGIIRTVVKAMDNYEGSGNTTLFIATSYVSDMLLLEDKNGHRLYKGITDLATAMGVNRIVKVPASIVPQGTYGIIVDLADYNVGADKGGAINMFDDFDIDYNAQKYLIETRCSGALTKPHSAIVLKASA